MKYDKEKLLKHIDQLSEICGYINHHIVWEKQEGQKDHFDNLPKAERIALIDVLSKLNSAHSALYNYKNWFE